MIANSDIEQWPKELNFVQFHFIHSSIQNKIQESSNAPIVIPGVKNKTQKTHIFIVEKRRIV